MKIRKNRFLWPPVCFILLISIVVQANALLSINDVWLMIIAKRWIAHGTYAHDFVENNPPLIIFISAIPVLIAKYCAISVINAMRIFVFTISFISLLFCNTLLKKIFVDTRFIASLTIGLAFIYWLLPGFSFGEREHMMVIFIMPYVLCLALRCQGQRIPLATAVIVGFVAALGFGLKPYFLIALILIEIYGLAVTKKIRFWFRPESVTFCMTLIVYFIAIFYLTPTYMTTIFPMVIHFYLGYEKYTWIKLLFHTQYLPVIASLILPVFFRKYFSNTHLLWVFYFAMIGFIFSFLLQEKLWYYHMLPMFSFSILVLLLCIDRWMRLLLGFFIGVPFIVFMITQNYFAVSLAHGRQHYLELGTAIHHYADNRPVYYFTTEFADVSSLVIVHASLSPRFPAFWMLPGLMHCLHEGPTAACYPRAIALKKYLLNAVADDFKKYHPRVVVINVNPKQFFLKHFNYIEFFSEDAEFKKEWRQYHYEETIADENIYLRDFSK